MTEEFPELTAFLTCGTFEDGTAREPGTMLVVWQDGRWRAWLNDRQVGDSAWLSCVTWTGLMAAVERGLAQGTMEWRRPRPGQGQRRR